MSRAIRWYCDWPASSLHNPQGPLQQWTHPSTLELRTSNMGAFDSGGALVHGWLNVCWLLRKVVNPADLQQMPLNKLQRLIGVDCSHYSSRRSLRGPSVRGALLSTAAKTKQSLLALHAAGALMQSFRSVQPGSCTFGGCQTS